MNALPWAWLLVAVPLACSSKGDEGDTPVDDGRFHPSPTGVTTTEADACAALSDAIQSAALDLGCTSTLRPCPDLLRVEFGTACMMYDQGTVDACLDFYAASHDCKDFGTPTACVLVSYPGSEPSGCP